ncbi:2-hydroxychromene-2-carboxylate isomerase [Stenotrophomonas sp. GD03701]|uniref:2-hydroxychromene-2-carboxylate isomerase n=1 Tax=Stenotrophomonas maltophilia TaxID=40324 RepID=A0A2J0SXZ0_STEMA|nr:MULTISPECIES: 2-hydroxychromene-2-carboxylate isomerase [Stenotrophomonas]MBA0312030.1 2-hydroxychromene-2-carboxylate isomerase [Stenotrophomonas maltophilia]MBH1746143.1 2-hydroxychromene-2-carboxylate isomerase [Stenotrophomonas maltophilia]MBH1865502.1 2-hydroxychromene-2-carboxylate isomerase [Stenotrophomonas maltophilia]MDH1390705.1 2-hydroxychromene-2-carboxylate isomerase [Stenotrophomonas sp. GD03701]MDH1394875.1 2-hydroxychromene-2-carboxylate isomerase [Stenotrophomonas sp. GD03
MATLRWYFDFVSPYSYLHWQKLKRLPQVGQIQPVPIAFGAVLHHLGNLGPAEIPAKRRFAYRHLQWTAQAEGTPMRFPPGHPFNPLSALRLCLAVGASAQAVDVLFDWIWRDGHAGDSAEALREPGAQLGIEDVASAITAPAVKEQLRRNTEAAIAAGVFGVPTLAIGDELFWGNDAHPLMAAVLADPTLLQQPEWQRLDSLPMAVQRNR